MSEQNNNTELLKKIKPHKMIYPILIGLSVVAYMLYSSYNPEAFKLVSFTKQSLFWITIALILMAFRDVGYMIRIRILTDNEFSWRSAFRVIMLWEFTSAITPSAIGGTSLAILFVNKEGISVGRSSAVVMATSFLDELFFILMLPLLFLIVRPNELFAVGGGLNWTNEFMWFAIAGYLLKFAYILLVAYGLFKNPRGLKWLLLQIARIPFFRRWRHDVDEAGTDLITNSEILRNKPFAFWLKALAATFFSWTSRYWIINAIFIAFFTVGDHFLLYARQLVMWIMMLVSPTPGGSGFSEFVFTEYLSDFLPFAGISILLALLWRLITYYPYLIVGAFIVPKWLKDKF